MSNSPQSKSPNSGKADAKVEFKTSNIGKWASKQEDPFAKQNRERQAKKQARNKKRQKAAPYVVAVCGIIAVGLGIWGLVVLIGAITAKDPAETPMISGGTNEEIADYKDALKSFYNKRPDGTKEEKTQDVENAVQNTLDTEQGKEYESLVRMAQAQLYVDNGLYEEASKLGEEISADGLSLEQQHMLYNILYISYYRIGDTEKAQEYFVLTYDIADQLEGANGG